MNKNLSEKEKRQKIYTTWVCMKQRCYNSNNKDYKNYGGRGIIICLEWLDSTSIKNWKGRPSTKGFENFYNDMKNSWFQDATIDRINSDGNYDPSNCQWLIRSENTKKRLIEKGNPFQKRPDGTSITSDRVVDGTNPFLGGDITRKNNKIRIENGTHNFLGKGNPNHPSCRFKGMILINNGIINKKIHPEKIQTFLNEGWIKGFIPKVRKPRGKYKKREFKLQENLI